MESDVKHRILMTGATGFVGLHLNDALRSGAYGRCDVIALSYDSGNGVDIQDATAIERAVRETAPTAIVHLAAIAAPADAKRSPRLAWDVNLTGTFNIADAAMRHAPDAVFVHAGSSEAYGETFIGSSAPLDEDCPLKPQTVYAATKAACDIMISQMARDGLQAIRFRPFNHTGPGQGTAYVVPAFARQVAEIMVGGGERVVHVGNLDVERDFTDVRDIVRAYAMAATHGPRSPKKDMVFNLASGRPWRIRAVLEHLITASGIAIEIVVDPERVRTSEMPYVAGDASRAAEAFGWIPEIPFEETLADVLRYQVENRLPPKGQVQSS